MRPRRVPAAAVEEAAPHAPAGGAAVARGGDPQDPQGFPACGWGPLKVAVEPARLHGGVPLPSRATIGRILRGLKDRGLIPERAPGRKPPRKRRAAGARCAVRRPKGFKAGKPGGMMRMDTCHLRLPGGGKACRFDFYDPAGRYAGTRFSSSITASSARAALERMLGEMPFPVLGIRTDNGSEFRGAFEDFLKERGIRHQAAHPCTPRQNAHVERFHATADSDWHRTCSNAATAGEPDREGPACIRHCNRRRPRQSLGGRTPAAFLLERYPELLLRDP